MYATHRGMPPPHDHWLLPVDHHGVDVGSVFVWSWRWDCLGLSVDLYLGCQLGGVVIWMMLARQLDEAPGDDDF